MSSPDHHEIITRPSPDHHQTITRPGRRSTRVDLEPRPAQDRRPASKRRLASTSPPPPKPESPPMARSRRSRGMHDLRRRTRHFSKKSILADHRGISPSSPGITRHHPASSGIVRHLSGSHLVEARRGDIVHGPRPWCPRHWRDTGMREAFEDTVRPPAPALVRRPGGSRLVSIHRVNEHTFPTCRPAGYGR